MTNRLIEPKIQFADQNGLPYAGGSLSFYASGTSTLLATYSDKALTIANLNPLPLDSAGRVSTDCFLQNVAYKVVLADVNNNQIWTVDPVYASDFSTIAQVQSVNGSPNGQLAGTAGSIGIPASMAWDFANKVLYVCIQTGSASTATWTAVNASTGFVVVPQPQGYLTPTSQTPIIPGDVISATSLFYTPYIGNLIPIFNGSSFVPTTFAEMTLTLTSSAHLANTIYDVFVFSNSGVITLATGPAWSNSGAGTGARGTGASTTQLTRLNGLLVNAVQISGVNGANTYTIGPNLAIYVGSILIDGTAGQITFHRTFGQSRKWAAWNAYNRAAIILKCGDSTASWSYNTNTWRASNGNSANSITTFCGLAEEEIRHDFVQSITLAANTAATQTAANGIGVNSTTAPSGKQGHASISNANGGGGFAVTDVFDATSLNTMPPNIGINTITALEITTSSSNNTTWNGTESNMELLAAYRG